jgi:hypothetical protein
LKSSSISFVLAIGLYGFVCQDFTKRLNVLAIVLVYMIYKLLAKYVLFFFERYRLGLYASFMSFVQMDLVIFFVFNLESQNNIFTGNKIHILYQTAIKLHPETRKWLMKSMDP